MAVNQVLVSVISILQDAKIPVCVIGELALNYYNVPRVVHDLEFCVPEASLSTAVSTLCSTGQYRPRPEMEYDIFTQYKKGFPALRVQSHPSLAIVLFSDTFFHLSPVEQMIVPRSERSGISVYSRQILDQVPGKALEIITFPRLSPYFIGLCRRFFESGDDMARIAAEQLVGGMKLDEAWIQLNLSEASPKVQYLASMLVDERFSSADEFWDLQTSPFAASDREEELQCIPGSGFQ
ncbi:uncharacterized protein N7500_006606 [Penicillium coprophilum]|uniref:uncharacterized protein n=1 Tax=Penicillium coprophilum TaxID=36646 RepID=UPI002393FB55|nr:uncharacterized protein N7500_006606 [Penicillium coprophilum]KAJ5164776.1 hypothetical protein N7500_006606 [Penicillium coprophilum]